MKNFKQKNGFAEIILGEKTIALLPLNKDMIYNIDEVQMKVEIRDGRVRIKESDCLNQVCVKQGWTNNLPLICLPNKVAVIVKAQGNKKNLITK